MVARGGEEAVVLGEATGRVEFVDGANNAVALHGEGAVLFGDVVDDGWILEAHWILSKCAEKEKQR